jgi:hypothetical protein
MRLIKSCSLSTRTWLVCCLLVLVAGLAACSQLNVSHLARDPWVVNVEQNATMKFWRFSYRIVPMRDQFGVRGEASILKDAVPERVDYIEDMWLACYLSDQDGDVLAQDIRVFAPRSLEEARDIDFDFILKPAHIESGPLYISFGYRMVMASDPTGNAVDLPFFASEGALSR